MFAVTPLDRPVMGSVRPPGSKSLTNRALVLASLAPVGVSRIYGPLDADDTMVMRRALRDLGVLIDDYDRPWLVLGTEGELTAPQAPIDVEASGTTARFVTAVAALATGRTVIDGTPRMRQRPIGALTDALKQLGVAASDTDGYPPVSIEGREVPGGRVNVDSTLSSQFASAVLMVAPMASGPIEINLGTTVVSRPYLVGTVEMMRKFGADVTADGDRFLVQPTGYRKTHVSIEADASAAVYPAVAAAITGGHISILGIPPNSIQPDLAVLDALQAMGSEVVRGDDEIAITGPSNGLLPIDADLSSAPDGAMAVAVAALFAHGVSRIRGLSTLRVKETDRLAALQTELSRVGGKVEIDEDCLMIEPGHLHGAEVETYDDHRMAMAMALVGLKVPGVVIRDPTTVSKTWPGFFDMLAAL